MRSTSTNATRKGVFEKHDEVNNISDSSEETSDLILPQRQRRVGVGANNNRPGEDFLDGNENMHRFIDKMLMSMSTEVRLSTRKDLRMMVI